ncbi:MAG: GDP-mannose 4,6-dehydratase, partial [Candidatus Peribacteraceae bacterium]|nr:GDP-mannose 4,6-dehydratase [Candidatus Peribacteraceae bacterium]
MSKMLITGGVGFIGVNAADHFLTDGWEVIIFDNFSRKGTDINLAFLETKHSSGLEVVRGDIRTDQDKLNALCDQVDVVLHLAAQVAVTTSVKDPREDFEINAFGTFNVLEAVRQSTKKPQLIYASTNKVYGGLEHMDVEEGEKRYSFAGGVAGVTEQTPLDFHSPYGCSKGSADQYVRDYSRLYDLNTVVLRQSCIYGPHQMGVEDQGWVAWFMIATMFNRPVT